MGDHYIESLDALEKARFIEYARKYHLDVTEEYSPRCDIFPDGREYHDRQSLDEHWHFTDERTQQQWVGWICRAYLAEEIQEAGEGEGDG